MQDFMEVSFDEDDTSGAELAEMDRKLREALAGIDLSAAVTRPSLTARVRSWVRRNGRRLRWRVERLLPIIRR